MKLPTTKIKLTDLVEDFAIYPRGQVDGSHIGHIAEAIRAGVPLPPILVEHKKHRIVDGLHRSRAWRRVHGDKSSIVCTFKSYSSEAEMVLDAARANAKHGRNLSAFDRVITIDKLLRLRVDKFEIAKALDMTLERVEQFVSERISEVSPLVAQTGHAEVLHGSGKKARIETVILKQPVLHMAGKRLTRVQADAIDHLGGNNQTFYVNQLILLIESGLIDRTNEALLERLQVLKKLLKSF